MASAQALLVQEDHLPAAPLVGVAEEPLAGDQDGGVAGVHGTPLETLDVDGAEMAGGRILSPPPPDGRQGRRREGVGE